MTGSPAPDSLLVQHLDHVQRVARFTARRVGLSADEQEECVSWVQVRLVEDDYALLRKFRGESTFKTFVTVVVAMLVRDYRVQLYGRWRPSAKATRLGPLAVRLERLMHRDGRSFEQAVLTLQSATETGANERALREIFRQLSPRPPLRPTIVEVTASAGEAARDRTDGALEEEELEVTSARLRAALSSELDKLSAEDRLALQMEVVDGATVAAIARALGVVQRPLYDRLKSLRRTLRARLEAMGVSKDDVQTLIGEGSP